MSLIVLTNNVDVFNKGIYNCLSVLLSLLAYTYVFNIMVIDIINKFVIELSCNVYT